VLSRHRCTPLHVRLPAKVRITFQRTDIADQHTAPHLQHPDGRTIRYTIRDARDLLRV
jgi:D-aminopeptidase